MTKWKTKTKKCPDCGRRYERWSPGTGSVSAEGVLYGSAYCKWCANERVKDYQRSPSGKVRDCAHCGTQIETTYRAENSHKSYGNCTGSENFYCSTACVGDHKRVYPISEMGESFCRAPVPGGCDMRRAATSHPMCAAHSRRLNRGTRIDTPINKVHSARVKRGMPR